MDIEDFKTYCRMNDECPFYVERDDENWRHNFIAIQLSAINLIEKLYDVWDSILIFDEAHNFS